MDEIRDMQMEDVHTNKKSKTEEAEEKEIETRLVEIKLDHPRFQVTLEDPVQVVSSSSSKVVILSSMGSETMIEPIWPTGKVIEERNKEIREEMQ